MFRCNAKNGTTTTKRHSGENKLIKKRNSHFLKQAVQETLKDSSSFEKQDFPLGKCKQNNQDVEALEGEKESRFSK